MVSLKWLFLGIIDGVLNGSEYSLRSSLNWLSRYEPIKETATFVLLWGDFCQGRWAVGTIRQVIIYNSHLVVMVLEKGIVDHISASRVGLLLFWWKRKMKMNSSKLHLLNVKRKETKSERYMVRDTQTWSKSITLKILSLSLGTLSTPERWPDFSSFFKHCSWKAQQTIVVPKNWGAYFSAWTKIWSDKCFEIMLTYRMA